MVRDVRLFINTLQHAVDLMTQKGIPATTTCGRRDGCLEYVVRIPVESADTSQPLPQASLDTSPAVPARADSACAAPAAIPVVRVVSARPEPPEPDGATVASLTRQG